LHDGLILPTSLQRKEITAICCAVRRNGLYTGILNSGYSLSEPVARNTCRVALTKVCFEPDFFAFVCYKRLANWTDTLTLNGFTRNAKHGFNSWKWSNLAWNFSNSLAIYFSIFPFCGLQLPLREKQSFSF